MRASMARFPSDESSSSSSGFVFLAFFFVFFAVLPRSSQVHPLRVHERLGPTSLFPDRAGVCPFPLACTIPNDRILSSTRVIPSLYPIA
jgi:hypothetical protein